MLIPLNDDWFFSGQYSEALASLVEPCAGLEPVRLPHTVKLLPQNAFSESEYQGLFGYVRFFDASPEWAGKRVFVRFEAAGHVAEVYCNGALVGTHACGYTAFELELTEQLRIGERNNLTVRVDSRDCVDVPPFGGVIDYMTFGGLYREAWLVISESPRIADAYISANDKGEIILRTELDNTVGGELRVTIRDSGGVSVLSKASAVSGNETRLHFSVESPHLWSCEEPTLYTAELELVSGGKSVDRLTLRFGFRTAVFTSEGFFLNGKPVKLRGLNRHQSYPHIGYAAPRRLQRLDAEILKQELACNAVRTSHYPQSRHFLDRCDELGLLVFTEIPGWQHIGGEAWRSQALANCREMIRQCRNHPCVVLWGVRINESADCDELYEQTNALAHELDPFRQTSGVRYIKRSHLLEDVYAYNDFLHNGTNGGCDAKRSVTSDMKRGYLVSEFNGHMYPTKPQDNEQVRLNHALRHARVLSDIGKNPDIAGGFGWCMFDYNTHKDFGSGDRVCYHGVMDMFRNPKLAAALYASQGEKSPVLEVSSSMDIGEHPAGYLGDIAVFTNADSVVLYKNDEKVGEYFPSPDYNGLAHPPIIISDRVGELLERNEGMSHARAEQVKKVLFAVAKAGQAGMPLRDKLRAAYLMAFCGFSFEDGARLYGKYIASWGGKVTSWRFDAIKAGRVVKSVTKRPLERLILRLAPLDTRLREDGTYDMALLRFTLTDEKGQLQPYAARVLSLEATGAVELAGPSHIPFAGGGCGAYVRTRGVAGRGRLVCRVDDAEPLTVEFEVETVRP